MVYSKRIALGSVVVLLDEINEIVERIVYFCDPDRVVLFGSMAAVSNGADIDLLILKACSEKPWREAARIREVLETSIPVGIIVRSPEEYQACLSGGDPFFVSVHRDGRLLYERADAKNERSKVDIA